MRSNFHTIKCAKSLFTTETIAARDLRPTPTRRLRINLPLENYRRTIDGPRPDDWCGRHGRPPGDGYVIFERCPANNSARAQLFPESASDNMHSIMTARPVVPWAHSAVFAGPPRSYVPAEESRILFLCAAEAILAARLSRTSQSMCGTVRGYDDGDAGYLHHGDGFESRKQRFWNVNAGRREGWWAWGGRAYLCGRNQSPGNPGIGDMMEVFYWTWVGDVARCPAEEVVGILMGLIEADLLISIGRGLPDAPILV